MFFKNISLILFLVPSIGGTFITGVEELPTVFLLYFLYKFDKSLALLFLTIIVIVLFLLLVNPEIYTLIAYLKLLSFAAITPFIRNKYFLDDLTSISYRLFIFLSIFGFIQYINLIPMGYFFSLFIERYHDGALGGYRGVQLLYPEPARASFYYLSIFIFGVVLNRNLNPTKKRNLTILFIVAQFFLIKSITGILLTLIISLLLLMFRKKIGIRFGLSYSIIIILFIFGYYMYQPSYKIIYIINSLQEMNLAEISNTLNMQSGGRFFGIVNVINSVYSSPLGAIPSLTDLNLTYHDKLSQPGDNISRNVATSSVLMFFKYFGLFAFIYIYTYSSLFRIKYLGLYFPLIFIFLIYSSVACSFFILITGVYTNFFITTGKTTPFNYEKNTFCKANCRPFRF